MAARSCLRAAYPEPVLDLLAAAGALAVGVAGLAAAALALLVAPFVAACDAAERRDGSATRAGALVLLADGAALLGALVALRGGPPWLALAALALPWAAAAAVRLVPPRRALLGARGSHEHGVRVEPPAAT